MKNDEMNEVPKSADSVVQVESGSLQVFQRHGSGSGADSEHDRI